MISKDVKFNLDTNAEHIKKFSLILSELHPKAKELGLSNLEFIALIHQYYNYVLEAFDVAHIGDE